MHCGNCGSRPIVRGAEMNKPCPFCGGARISIEEGTTYRWRHARCDECGARAGGVRIQTTGDGTDGQWEAAAEVEAMKVWNTRHETKAEAAAAKVLQVSHIGDQNFIAAICGPECDGLRIALVELADTFREDLDYD